MPLVFYTKEQTNIPNGQGFTLEWTPDKDVNVKYLLLRKADGNPWTATKVSVKVYDKAITHPDAPAGIFGRDILNALPVNWTIKASQKLEVNGTNAEGTSITVYMTAVCEVSEMPSE